MAARLRAAPVTVPVLLAVAIFLAWVPFDGGQPITRWAPGMVAVLALLGLAVAAVPGRGAEVPAPVKIATLLLTAFTAWSFLSIAWADDQGAALEGADRTLLYLAVFALFALWPQRPDTAAVVLGAWTLGMIVFATITLVRVGTVADPGRLFLEGRLIWPAGYANAAAALWLMPLWPAITLAASVRVPWPVRGLLAAGAVVLLDVALLSQSRGSVLAMPICAVLFVAFVPGRLRHVAVLVPIALAAGAAVPAILDVGDVIGGTDAGRIAGATHAALRTGLLAAVLAGVVVAAAAALERRRPLAPATARALRRGWAIAVVAGAVVLGIGGLVVAGGPVQPLKDGWHSFKGGYEDNNASNNRLVGGLGSNRYDFYRVSLDVFRDHPITGVGADNFFEDYLVRGDSPETPAYPHNLALRTLAQTGLVGALLLLGALAFAVLAAARAMRRPDPLAVAVAGGATIGFAYWVVHGMTDWFWEWAGLGAPAFALLGLACALAPRREPAAAPARVGARRVPARVAAPVAVALLLGALAVAGPWLAERDVERAGAIFATRPFESYARLDRAADLDPFSDRPALVAGSIALRYGDLERARAAFTRALERNPRGQYATLELGAIASVQGDRSAGALLDRAVALAPRDATAREARHVVRQGGVVDITALNRRILSAGQRFSAP
ncbi:MAG TPA: O-antigen ligase family protein [Baekduia sp.]|uniref:O-antigen ligase family protein n=1 Tax=Baekduia sp. TaxID=2600305 RepID=UPI002B5257B8|nr:O-antigen ligase family protein [Baekduia sp.]HMJ34644.1 O-antigen ligase family protein [Baekduia sp.]